MKQKKKKKIATTTQKIPKIQRQAMQDTFISYSSVKELTFLTSMNGKICKCSVSLYEFTISSNTSCLCHCLHIQ